MASFHKLQGKGASYYLLVLLLVVSTSAITSGLALFLTHFFYDPLTVPTPADLVALRWADVDGRLNARIEEWRGDDIHDVFSYSSYEALLNAREESKHIVAFTTIGDGSQPVVLHAGSLSVGVAGEAVSLN
jgi:hypothetical protein